MVFWRVRSECRATKFGFFGSSLVTARQLGFQRGAVSFSIVLGVVLDGSPCTFFPFFTFLPDSFSVHVFDELLTRPTPPPLTLLPSLLHMLPVSVA